MSIKESGQAELGSRQWRQLENAAPVRIARPIRGTDCLTWRTAGLAEALKKMSSPLEEIPEGMVELLKRLDGVLTQLTSERVGAFDAKQSMKGESNE